MSTVVRFITAEELLRMTGEGAAGSRPRGYWEGGPDLAVTVLSPSDTVENVEEKVDDYLAAGSKLVWLINPKRKTLTIHRKSANPVILHESDELHGEDVVPGFACRIVEIFA